MIKLDDTLEGIWFMDINPSSNWLAALNAKPDGIEATWRVLYYTPSSPPFDESSRSSWYKATAMGSVPEAIEKMRHLVRMLSEHADGECIELLRDGRTTEEFFRAFTALPFVNIKTQVVPPPGEARTGKTS